MHKIDKTISNVTIILNWWKIYLKVAWQIKKVICILQCVVYFVRQISYCIFVWNVSNHDSSSWIKTNLIQYYFKHIYLVVDSTRYVLKRLVFIVRVGGMITTLILIIHCASITFLKWLIDWKNTPNLTRLLGNIFL